MSFDNLLVEREPRIALLTIQRPQRLNALDARTLDELREAFVSLQHDDQIRCVILTGAGEKAFVAGADVSELAQDTPDAARRRALHLEASLFGLVAATEDMREGTAAFLEKRKPTFKGR